MNEDESPSRLRGVPLRWQLTAAMVALMLIALVAVNFAAAAVVKSVLISRVDSQLVDTARDQLRRGGLTNMPSASDGSRVRDSPALLSGFFTKVVDANGEGQGFRRLPEGSNQEEPDLPPLDANNAGLIAGRPFTVPSIDGVGEWRVVVTSQPGGYSYVTAVSLSDVHNTLSRFLIPLIALSALTLLLVGTLGLVVVRQRLQALGEVEDTAARIAGGDLSQRVPQHDPRTEVGSLGAAINSMLSMIESSFAQQKQSEEAARESEARMRRFVADASHELRTPLTSIRGYAELTRQTATDNGPGNVELSIERIESEARRMGALVEDLLLLARLDREQYLDENRGDRSETDLVELAQDIAKDASVMGPRHNFELVVPNAPVVIDANVDQLRRAITNLVTNVFKHTPDGTKATLTVDSYEDTAIIEVADNGQGIADEAQARVFDRFFRADESRDSSSGGTGLGLSIVNKIIEFHNGSISVQSELGSGTKFLVRLPLVSNQRAG